MLSKDLGLIKMIGVQKGYDAKRFVAEFPRKKLFSCFCETPACYARLIYDRICRPQNRQWSTSHCVHWRER